jgi:tRNA(fMet)-specific endonuclease VapC
VLRRLDNLVRQVPVAYPADARICRHYAEQFIRLKTAGTPIGANDLWIACHALAADATLVTHRVPGTVYLSLRRLRERIK